jgi:hypothetical protein
LHPSKTPSLSSRHDSQEFFGRGLRWPEVQS